MRLPRKAKYLRCGNPECDSNKEGSRGFTISTAMDEKAFCSLACEKKPRIVSSVNPLDALAERTNSFASQFNSTRSKEFKQFRERKQAVRPASL